MLRHITPRLCQFQKGVHGYNLKAISSISFFDYKQNVPTNAGVSLPVNNFYTSKSFLNMRSYSEDQSQKANTLTKTQKLKKAITEYGSTVIVFHVGISLISLGTCYCLVSTGLNVNNIFETLGIQEWANSKSELVNNAGTFAVAYAIHKVFAPVRISITLASAPFIVRYLRSIGFLKK